VTYPYTYLRSVFLNFTGHFVITVSTLPPSKSSSDGIHVAESEINTKNPKFKSPLKRFTAKYSLTALKYPIVPKYCDLWQVGSFSGYSGFLHRGEDFIS
jgi:hypothetical protein